MGSGGAPVGHGFRASNNSFRGPCIQKLRNPAAEDSDGLVGLRWGVWWVPGGPGEAQWGSVGPVECLTPVKMFFTPNPEREGKVHYVT